MSPAENSWAAGPSGSVMRLGDTKVRQIMWIMQRMNDFASRSVELITNTG